MVWSNTESVIKVNALFSTSPRFDVALSLLIVLLSSIVLLKIQDVLRNLNTNVFDEIDKWVHASFDAIRACRTFDSASATCPYPILDSASIAAPGASRQIFTALLFTSKSLFHERC